jgi:hypothetical protein
MVVLHGFLGFFLQMDDEFTLNDINIDIKTNIGFFFSHHFLNGTVVWTPVGGSAAAEAVWPSSLKTAAVAVIFLTAAVLSLIIVAVAVLPVVARSWILIYSWSSFMPRHGAHPSFTCMRFRTLFLYSQVIKTSHSHVLNLVFSCNINIQVVFTSNSLLSHVLQTT